MVQSTGATSSATATPAAAEAPPPISPAADPSARFSTLAEVARLLSSSLEPDDVLERVMDVVIAVTGAERGFILLRTPAPDAPGRGTTPPDAAPDTTRYTLEPAVARNLDKTDIDRRESGISRTLCERVFRTGRAELVGDALADERTAAAESVTALRLRSVLCAPLSVKANPIGVVYLDHRAERRRFDERQLRLLEAVGEQAAIAIENARLYDAARRQAREIADLKAHQDAVLRSVGTAIVGLDLNGHVVSLNRAAEALFGIAETAALRAPYVDVFGEIIAARLLAPFAAAAGAGRPSGVLRVTAPLGNRPPTPAALTPIPDLALPTGSVLAERHLRCAVAPLRDGAGAVCGLIVTAEDETARVVAEQAQVEAERARDRVEHELRLARDIQLALLPKAIPELPGWRLAAHYSPALTVGGDFYDLFPFGASGALGVVIGDVTGKGVAAALLMAATRTAIRAAARHFDSPGRLLAEVNAQLLPDMPRRTFVTCLCAVLDPVTGRLSYASAGHLPPLLLHHGLVSELTAVDLPLGVLPDASYRQHEAVVSPGDTLLLYSDGVVEAHAPSREMFGFDGLAAALAASGPHPPIDAALQALHAFTGERSEQEDDVTLVSLVRLEA